MNASAPHHVYRAYNDDGELLYIGCTGNVAKRFRTWSSSSDAWTSQLRHLTVETFPDRATARAAEAAAIKTEDPRHNKLMRVPPCLPCECICHADAIVLWHGKACCPEARYSDTQLARRSDATASALRSFVASVSPTDGGPGVAVSAAATPLSP